jgi:hypothetical protein
MRITPAELLTLLNDFGGLGRELRGINDKLGVIMTQQEGLDADVAKLSTALGDVGTQTGLVVTAQAAIVAEIAALQEQVANGQTVDLTNLDALAASASTTAGQLDTAVGTLTGLVPAAPPAPPAT